LGFFGAVKSCFAKYATFSGRASRAEFWYFGLFMALAHIVATIADAAIGIAFESSPGGDFENEGWIDFIVSAIVLLPSASVQVRRLHDRDRSGSWWWLFLLPVIGWIWIIVWSARKGTEGPNRFGPDPLAPAAKWPIAQL
jgi:uncharacterized membrane protein YhaH (DUF805 family)